MTRTTIITGVDKRATVETRPVALLLVSSQETPGDIKLKCYLRRLSSLPHALDSLPLEETLLGTQYNGPSINGRINKLPERRLLLQSLLLLKGTMIMYPIKIIIQWSKPTLPKC